MPYGQFGFSFCDLAKCPKHTLRLSRRAAMALVLPEIEGSTLAMMLYQCHAADLRERL